MDSRGWVLVLDLVACGYPFEAGEKAGFATFDGLVLPAGLYTCTGSHADSRSASRRYVPMSVAPPTTTTRPGPDPHEASSSAAASIVLDTIRDEPVMAASLGNG